MYGRIVFGTDGRESAMRAGDVAVMMAKTTSSRVTVVHVYRSPVGAEELLAGALDALEAAGMRRARIEGVSVAGAPAEALCGVAEESDAGLIVVGRGAGQGFTLADLTRTMARRTPCDLLIVADFEGRDRTKPYERIAIATDGSATADRAARKGFELAEAAGASVDIIFIGHPATGELVTQDTIVTYGAGVKTRVHLLQGEPGSLIVEKARELGADLVVVGNKGLSGAKGFLLGSVPEKVIESADRDVLVCRTVRQIVSELGKGEGGVIERRGEKLAAYMDDAGELHLLSARCTHMGCTVAWNPGEATFDCPCHGSRFGPTGEVVNGPAARPLPPA